MKQSKKYREICVECGAVFLGGPNAFLCPACRKKRIAAAARRRHLSHTGNEARKKKNSIPGMEGNENGEE